MARAMLPVKTRIAPAEVGALTWKRLESRRRKSLNPRAAIRRFRQPQRHLAFKILSNASSIALNSTPSICNVAAMATVLPASLFVPGELLHGQRANLHPGGDRARLDFVAVNSTQPGPHVSDAGPWCPVERE